MNGPSDVDRLLEVFANAARGQWDALDRADHKEANSQFDRYVASYRELRRLGAPGQQGLTALLRSPHPAVRMVTGAYALEFAPREAEPVLQELASGSGLLAFNADMTLREWRAGRAK
jgi:hypothetical protein